MSTSNSAPRVSDVRIHVERSVFAGNKRVEKTFKIAEILLKNRILPEDERYEIDGDIEIRKRNAKRVFIGHGNSPEWKKLKTFLVKDLKLEYDEFNRISPAGFNTQQRLTQMLDNCGFAFLVFTREDSHGDETRHARENAIHEAGLFQSRLGWQKAIILLEDGCETFSNIDGLTQIRFPRGQIAKKFTKVRDVLVREALIPPQRQGLSKVSSTKRSAGFNHLPRR